MPEEDPTRICDKVTTKRVDLGLELLADLFEGFCVEGAAQRVVEVFDELGRVILLSYNWRIEWLRFFLR